jgi:glyoxylase-like metal-dependent hydrolase (beta-lactamase superfamily II)
MAHLSGAFSVGSLTIHQLSDGAERARRATWFNGIDPMVWAPAVGVSDSGALFSINYGCFAITGGGQVTLVDTGAGSRALQREGVEGAGQMMKRLAGIGIGRSDIDVVLQTHMHADHCGWLVDDDRETLGFPNANVYLHASELEYWTTPPSDDNPMSPFVRSRIEPVRAAGRISTFDHQCEVTAEVTAIPTPGHTPGHISVLVQSDGASALLLGDVAHHPIHLEHHDWLPRIDMDPQESIRSRGRMAALAVETDAIVTAPHMPILTLGRVIRVANQYKYISVQTPADHHRTDLEPQTRV